jgi:tripartite-type tricarboxylate transporter receptor subunit TctC
MKFMRSLALVVWASTAFVSDNASAQGFPTRPITVIMPFAGGSASDVVSRVLFNKMAAILGRPIVVENKPGAGGNLGTALAARSAPDGYTLVGAASGPMAANLTLYKELGYDPQKDLVLISPFASFTVVVTASNKLGVTTVKDLIERARKEPGALNYGSVGIGSSQHLAGEYFAQVADVKLTHVPYRNIAQFGPDLIAGTVQLGFAWYPNVSGPLTANGAVPLAVAGDARLAVLPDTPTTAGVPRDILERLNAALNEALKDPSVRVRFEEIGAAPIGLELDQAGTFLSDEVVKYRDIITKADREDRVSIMCQALCFGRVPPASGRR